MCIWELLTVIKDIKPCFMLISNGGSIKSYSFEELATDNRANSKEVRKIHTMFGNGKTTYLIDCEG